MKNTIFDVSSEGLSKHITTNGIIPEVLSAVVQVDGRDGRDGRGGDFFLGFLPMNREFLAFFFSVMAIFFIMPQIYCLRDFFSHCFKPRCWYKPFKRYTMDLVWWFINVFTIVSVVAFFDTHQRPRTAFDVNIFIAVFVLILLFLTFRWFWINSFWNYHSLKGSVAGQTVLLDGDAQIALGFALFFSIAMLLTVIALGIVFIIAKAWISLIFLIPLFIWTIVLLVWTALVYSCVGCAKVCEPVCVQEPICQPPLLDGCGRPIVYGYNVQQQQQKSLNHKK